MGEAFNEAMIIAVQKFKLGGSMMYALLALSIVGLGFILDRFIYLFYQNSRLSPKRFLSTVAGIFNEGGTTADQKVDKVIAFLEKRRSIVANIMLEAAYKWKEAKDAGFNKMELKSYLQSNLDEKSLLETPALEARMGGLGNIATLAPLVGLLGTVAGMIMSFDVMANSPGGAKPDELAEGISVALITTAGGLYVAIPVLMFYGWLKGIIDGRINQIEEAGKEFVDALTNLR